MTKKKESSFLPYLAFAREFLKEHPIITLKDLEEQIHERIEAEANEEKMANSKRTRFQHLVDWVKATLTRHGEIRYVMIGGERYIIFLKASGLLDGVEYCQFHDALRVLSKLETLIK